MHRRTWQKFEQRVAEWFGGRRTGPMQETDANDINHPQIHCQCKHSKKHAVIGVWDKAKAKTLNNGKIPVVALGVKGRPGFWLLVHSGDLMAIANQKGDISWIE